MIKMLVSSFYNTLIDKEDAIPMSTMLEIDKLKSKGIIFSVCTNRSFKDVLYYNNDYPFIDYIISLNGTYIYDTNKDKCIYKKQLTNSIIKKIEELFKDYELIYYKEDNIIYKIEIKIKKKDLSLIDKLEEIDVSKSILKIDKEYFLEITSKNTYDGVKELLNKLKLTPHDVVAIIGNLSEKEIIKNIDKTYIVSNASKDLKLLGNYKTKSNNSKGVEQVIKKYN